MFKPPTVCKLVGSSKYAPLTNLPSQQLPPVSLLSNCTYKPSWMQHVEKSIQPINNTTPTNNSASTTPTTNQTNNNISNTNNALPNTLPNSSNSNSNHSSNNIFPPSPLHSGFRPPPPPYEMASPATSTASSYLNKNLNSVEPVPTPNVQRTPEASSLVLNILLTDTAVNIFRDHNFDSCTLCVCNFAGKGNIRGADAGIYLLNSASDKHHASAQPGSPYPGGSMGQPPPYGGLMNDEDFIRCSCGFSAVVNRKLAHGTGLFYEDEMEITGKWALIISF